MQLSFGKLGSCQLNSVAAKIRQIKGPLSKRFLLAPRTYPSAEFQAKTLKNIDLASFLLRLKFVRGADFREKIHGSLMFFR